MRRVQNAEYDSPRGLMVRSSGCSKAKRFDGNR